MHANNGPAIVFDNLPPVPSYVRVMEFSVTDRSVNFEHLCKICSSISHLQSYLRLHKVLFNFHRRCERCRNGAINLRRDSSTCDGQVWRCTGAVTRSATLSSQFVHIASSVHRICHCISSSKSSIFGLISTHNTSLFTRLELVKKRLLISTTFVERFVQLF